MDLVDRYVNSVRTFLPRGQQDDIVKELSENIRAEMDDREAELGRPLTEDEQDAILQQHGHPMIVAGRYQPGQGSVAFGRQLIGTALFPFYLRVLGIAMGISFAVYLVVLGALIASGNEVTVSGVMNSILLQVFFQFGSITLIFAAVEHYLPTMHWNARSLPANQPKVRKVGQISRLESIAQIVALLVLLVWLRIVFETPALIFGPVSDTYRIGPVWERIALPTLLIFVVYIAQAVVNLVRPDWTRLRPAVRLVTDIAGLGILIYLLQAGQWVVLANPGSTDGTALNTINEWVYYGMLCTAVGFVIATLMDAWKLIRGERKPAASAA
jgi:hypothetical protein